MTYLLNIPAAGDVFVWQELSRDVVNLDAFEAQDSSPLGSSTLSRPTFSRPTLSRHKATLEPVIPALRQKGYRVKAFSTKEAVLQAVLNTIPDLIVIYLQTAENEGYEFCQTLRKLARSSTVPVVFVGTRDAEIELMNALRCGGNDYIQLPVSAEAAWLRMERQLRTVQMMRSLEAEKESLHQKIWSYHAILRQQEEAKASLKRENQTLHQLAFTDGLTQVANRRSFNETLPAAWEKSRKTHQPLSLLLCDIDYFKRYNDTYGHLSGDVCLKAVADALVRAAHRKSDQVARYGGEEFAILLPATDAKGAQQVALAAHSELARAQVPHRASLVKPVVSLSIGICTLTPDDSQQQAEILIHGADEALYTAKLRGRDRSVANTARGLISIEPKSCTYSGPEKGSRQKLTKLVINSPTPATVSSQ